MLESALKGHDLARITILNVDDTNEPRYAVTRLLRKTGFTVIEAKNGREALAKASSFRPSLIILDVNLPDMLGFDVARAFEAVPKRATLRLFISQRHIRRTQDSRDLTRAAETGSLSIPVICWNCRSRAAGVAALRPNLIAVPQCVSSPKMVLLSTLRPLL